MPRSNVPLRAPVAIERHQRRRRRRRVTGRRNARRASLRENRRRALLFVVSGAAGRQTKIARRLGVSAGVVPLYGPPICTLAMPICSRKPLARAVPLRRKFPTGRRSGTIPPTASVRFLERDADLVQPGLDWQADFEIGVRLGPALHGRRVRRP